MTIEDNRMQIEAAAFRTLVDLLRKRTDVQNIDLMNLSGFCRNCLAKWVMAAASDVGEAMDYEQARQFIYGMPYDEWKALHQKPASAEQRKKMAQAEQH